jgi:hypothetical protein
LKTIAAIGLLCLTQLASADELQLTDSSITPATAPSPAPEIAAPYEAEAPAPSEMPVPCSGATPQDLSWLEQTHQRLSQGLCDQVARLDLFFGNMQYEDEYPKSFIRIRNAISWSDASGDDVKFDPHINARIRLPSLENRFNLLISDDSEDRDALSTSNENLRFDEDKKNRVSTALRWIALQSDRMEIDLDTGFRGIDPFTRARYRNRWSLSERQQIRFLQEIFWKNSERFGERTEINYDQILSSHFLFRINNASTFSEVSEGVNWTQQFSILQKLDALRALTYTAAFTGHTRPDYVTDDYGISIRYRKNIYHSWLFAEIEPQINWPAELYRDTTQTIIFRLEVQLGKP